MSQAETLLSSMAEHSHSLVDTDTYFVIDPETRTITNDTRRDIVLIQRDHNSAVFTFQLPRYIDGHDMTLCNRVYVHFNNIDGETGEENADLAEMTDLRVDPNNSDMVISSWTITRQATQLIGILSFLVQYACVEDGVEVYEFHTDFFSDVQVKKGRNNSEAAIIEYTNILEQWYQRIFGTGESVIANIIETSNEQQALVEQAIESKGQEVLASIPEDYTTTYNMADSALRSKAAAIVESVEGEVIVVDDCSDNSLRSLRVFGKSIQPTTIGKNLCPGYKRGAYNNSTGEYSIEFTGYYCSEKTPITRGVNYVISNGLGKNPSLIHAYDADDNWLGSTTLNNLPENAAWIGVNYLTSDDLKWIQIEIGTEATDYEPYTGGKPSPSPEYPQEIHSIEDIAIDIYGKNILNPSDVYCNPEYTELYSSALLALRYHVKKGKTYTLSFDTENTGKFMYINPACGFLYTQFYMDGTRKSFTNTMSDDIISDVQIAVVSISENTDIPCGAISNVQLTLVDDDSNYEEYTKQSFEFKRTLPGIPVDSGGNYTDPEGQQWICDEVDFERGVYIQRIQRTNSEDWSLSTYNVTESPNGIKWQVSKQFMDSSLAKTFKDAISSIMINRFPIVEYTYENNEETGDCMSAYGHDTHLELRFRLLKSKYATAADVVTAMSGTVVHYPLATPIETPLTSDELLAFRQLHSNYPVTTVVNNENAYMSLTYNADTKTWIKNLVSSMIAE